jgi:hypothetical protein
MADLAASTPTTPRNGSYLAVFGITGQEGGGDVRVEVAQCGECFALVENSKLDAHEGRHAAEAGAEPKAR